MNQVEKAQSITRTDNYRTPITVRSHTVIADEPEELNGTDLGPTPIEYLLTSLASCTSITLRMYANRKEWQLKEIKVDVTLEKKDDADGNELFLFDKKVELIGDLDAKQRKRLMQIADKCRVHKVLSGNVFIQSTEV